MQYLCRLINDPPWHLPADLLVRDTAALLRLRLADVGVVAHRLANLPTGSLISNDGVA